MVSSLIKRIAQHLDRHKIPYMIIGGQAVLLYGRPRLTRDIDITLGIDADRFSVVNEICRDMNLIILPDDPKAFAETTRVLPAEDRKSKTRVDFIFSFTLYETQAIARAWEVLIDDYPVRFASREDVIIHKMLAGRAIDIEDVKYLLIKSKGQIDLTYVKQWLTEFSSLPEHGQVLTCFVELQDHLA